MSHQELTAVSLYAGAGGIDYGFEAAGYDTRVAVEMDEDCCETLRANGVVPVICEDIHETTSDEILEKASLEVGEASVLHGGPPCQPFSKSGYWNGGDSLRLDDSRSTTLHAYMRCVRDVLPEVFLLENVHGINYSGKEEGFRFLQDATERINQEEGTDYTISWSVLNTADYGVPQARKRFFLVAHRDGDEFEFPTPTHAEDAEDDRQRTMFDDGREPYVTAWEAIGDVEPGEEESLDIGGKWADLVPSIPEGENYLWHTDRKGGEPLFGWRRRYWSFLLKLAKDRPSWTIQAQPGSAIGPFHWENRRLAVEEMARLQTFPKNLTYAGGRTSVQKQLGNAVPSLMAEVLARAIAVQFFGVEYADGPRLAIERKTHIPDPEPIEPVPEKYHDRIGDHEEHPGEGQGPKARSA